MKKPRAVKKLQAPLTDRISAAMRPFKLGPGNGLRWLGDAFSVEVAAFRPSYFVTCPSGLSPMMVIHPRDFVHICEGHHRKPLP